MHGSYSPFLIILSVFIGTFSSYTALTLAQRISDKSRPQKIIWIMTASFIIGMGIFSMHFVGMLAMNVNVSMTYEPFLLFLSLVAAILSSFIAFSILYLLEVTKIKLVLSGLMLGIGIILLHYIAIAAIQEPIVIQFTSFFFFLSIFIALFFSFMSIKVFFQIKQESNSSTIRNIISSILLGLTIFLVHDIGVKAIAFLPHSHSVITNGVSTFELAIAVSIITLLIMMFAIFLAFLDYRNFYAKRRLLGKIKESEERYRRLVEQSPEPIIVHDGQKIIFVNEMCLKLVNATDKNDLIGKPIIDFISPRFRKTARKHLQMIREGSKEKTTELQIMTLNGSTIDVAVSGVGVIYDNRSSVQLVVRDITEHKKIGRELEEDRQRYRSLFEHNPDGVYSIDQNGAYTDTNPCIENMLGYSKKEFLNMTYDKIVDPAYLDRTPVNFNKALVGKPQNYEIVIIHKNGQKIPVNITNIPIIVDGKVIGVYGIAKDITKEKEAQKKMKELAFMDQLTQLPNRTWFYKKIERLVGKARAEKKVVAFLAVDFDNFKHVNDRLGHHAGDLFLRKVAERMKDSLQKQGIISRIGGDEFFIVLENVTEEDVIQVAKKILKDMNQPITLFDHEIVITLSIGISMSTIHISNVNTLIQQADFALYSAKEKGKNNYQFFTEDLNEKVKRKHQLEEALRGAIEKEEFTLYYQPQVHLQTGTLVGVEALLRWNPSFGFVSPAEFIPIAEETGLIVPIGEWVMKEACRQIVNWRQQGVPKVRVSVNASARQFMDPAFAWNVKRIIEEEGVDPHDLEIEITESVMLNVEESLQIIEAFKTWGIQIAIDDFGTGYSSLNLISMFEFNTLKLDKSLIDDIKNDRRMSILKTVIGAKTTLGAQIVIEGIETKEQVDLLKEFDVIGQGYYFSRPLPPEHLEHVWDQ